MKMQKKKKKFKNGEYQMLTGRAARKPHHELTGHRLSCLQIMEP